MIPRRLKLAERVATLLPDGRLDIGGTVYADPSEAAAAITGKPSNGWWLFLVDQKTRRSLRQVKREYLDSVARDVEEDDGDDGDDDEL